MLHECLLTLAAVASSFSPEAELHRGRAVSTEHVAEVVRMAGQTEAASEADSATSADERELLRSYPGAMERIRSHITMLEAESLEESTAALADIEMFLAAGSAHEAKGYPATIPLQPEVGLEDTIVILSNRRVIKMYEELSREPKERAGALVSDAIDSMLPVYADRFAKKFRDTGRLKELSENRTVLFSHQRTNNEDGTPTLLGARYAVLSLVYLAGALKLEGAADAVRRVVDEAVRQRDEMYAFAENGYDKHKALDALVVAGLYSRQVLMVGMAGVAGLEHEVRSRTGNRSPEEGGWSTVRAVPFNAFLTPFELPYRQKGGTTDFSLGSFELPGIGYAGDEAFDAVMEAFAADR